MKLALIKDDGTVIPVLDEIETYDLGFVLARSEIADAIRRELEKLGFRYGKSSSPEKLPGGK